MVALYVLLAGLSGRSCADDAAEADRARSKPGDTSGVQFPQPAPHDTEARERARQLGVVMLGGIVIIGIALLAFVLIWGNRVRRTAREPLPPVARVNEMWFLKPPKKQGPDDVIAEQPRPDDE